MALCIDCQSLEARMFLHDQLPVQKFTEKVFSSPCGHASSSVSRKVLHRSLQCLGSHLEFRQCLNVSLLTLSDCTTALSLLIILRKDHVISFARPVQARCCQKAFQAHPAFCT